MMKQFCKAFNFFFVLEQRAISVNLEFFKIKVQRFDCFFSFSKRCESNAVIG